MKVLIVGGAGYIGSHMVQMLLQHGHDVITYDNLSSGYQDAVLGGEFVLGDLSDTSLLNQVFIQHHPEAVMHFASFIQVGESVQRPDKYYQNNVSNTLNLLNVMIEHDVKKFIFSSTAAIFGEPEYIPIDEKHPTQPLNPYGRSKLIIEQILTDYDRAFGLKSIALRYFNAAGADPSGLLGERHQPETHLIPLALEVASGRRPHLQLFGRDYDTPDGTCIRDYIHIVDLCSAHLQALLTLSKRGQSDRFNLGNGVGYSVQEIINAVESVTGKKITIQEAQRRAGDPARLVADAKKAKELLGWNPVFFDIKDIIRHAWNWECRLN